MAVRNWKDIRTEMLQDMIGYLNQISNPVTYIDDMSNLVGLLTPVAKEIQRKEFDLDRVQRNMDVFLAEGSALDDLGSRRGIYRLGPAKAGTVLAVYGGPGTLANGAVVRSSSGATFQVSTGSTVILTGNEPLRDIHLMKQVQCVATQAGPSGNAPSFTITQIVSGATGTVKVTNMTPATGGEVAETDAQYRDRIIRAAGMLSHRVRDKYLSVIQAANPDVLRVWIARGQGVNGVLVKCMSRSLGTFTPTELNNIRTVIVDDVFPDQPEMANMGFADFRMDVTVELSVAGTIQPVYHDMISRIVAYVNPSVWPFGTNVRDDILFAICAETSGIRNMERSTFIIQDGSGSTIRGDVPVPTAYVPRLTQLTVRDSKTNTAFGSGVTVPYSYVANPPHQTQAL